MQVLYLIEQKQLEMSRQNQQKAQEEAELRKFRSRTLKAPALANPLAATLTTGPEPSKPAATAMAAPIVVVKARKRDANQLDNKKQKIKKVMQVDGSVTRTSARPTTTATATPAKSVTTAAAAPKAAPKPPTSILLGYSSSDSSDDEGKAR
ncbi:TPA: hypothetical protein N0F65_012676 [Lagenidium giganteum]|uniref:Uncharacterized protein n=1 Tax=Lagenidium giganteum TaxID=4803 RepID=A0AAV2YN13_9STRA|nr:TPA: hypothetical protein N0F65_012676 [Lagenidium giganteum]